MIITQTIFVDTKVWCEIANILSGQITVKHYEESPHFSTTGIVYLNRTRKCPLELQVPMQILGPFGARNKTNIDYIRLCSIIEKEKKGWK